MSTVYKVLVGGRSCNGGDLDWSMPSQADDGRWRPGDWESVGGALELCVHGLHLTSAPAEWWQAGATVYVAEYDGEHVGDLGSDRKIAVRRARLLRPLTDDELAGVQIFTAGAHTVRAGCAVASGSASVEAWGSASVVARGSASVVARGSASVEAWESASVEAWGSASVEAWESASVVARGSASVVAWESASVVARGSASVVAWESASVEARESASVVARGSALVHTPAHAWGQPTVRVVDHAVWVNHRGGAPVVHAVTAPEIVIAPAVEAAPAGGGAP